MNSNTNRIGPAQCDFFFPPTNAANSFLFAQGGRSAHAHPLKHTPSSRAIRIEQIRLQAQSQSDIHVFGEISALSENSYCIYYYTPLLTLTKLPYRYPHDSGLIQWARGNFALKRSVAARPDGLGWKKTSTPITPIPRLKGDSAPPGVNNTAGTRGGDQFHSREGWGPVRKDQPPKNKNPRF